jgi:amino acid adenylation domain-containing protein
MIKLLHEYVTAQAGRVPEAVALAMYPEAMTYGELDRLSNQLARTLKEGGCKKGDRVCLLVPKSPAAIVGILGILKADCIYVPLNLQNPAVRQRKIIEICECRWIVSGGGVTHLLDGIFGAGEFPSPVSVGCLDVERIAGTSFRAEFSSADFSAYSSDPLEYQNKREDPAHILFTSGSTGAPKGVVITHASVIHFVEWARSYFGLGPGDRASCHSPLHFDLSTFDIFGTLSSGAQLYLVPPELNILPHKLSDFIRQSELTQWFSVPSILNYMAKFDAVQFNDFPALRELLWCGEVFQTSSVIYWMKRLPHVRFTNLYGPTEATIASSYYTVPKCPEDERFPIPIGTACPGEELLVLDDKLERVPPGEIGNLYIGGAGLSSGYWKEPDKTRAVFLPNPHGSDPSDRIYKTGDLAWAGKDRLLHFVGRADFQIKSRGYRIELGEIETALNTIPDLHECAVVAVPIGGFEGAKICCAYVPLSDQAIAPVSLRKELSRLVPPYMLPADWLAMQSLPKNANGKIDRPRLVELFKQREELSKKRQRENRPLEISEGIQT